jgi:hypothetical protein
VLGALVPGQLAGAHVASRANEAEPSFTAH